MQSSRAEGTVHVVEDDRAVRDSIVMLLELKGFAVRAFDSAEALLRVVQPEWAGCMLLDVRMPGMSGLELQAALAARSIRLPVIIITAHGDIAAARTAFKGGAVDFLQKPLDEDALLAAVRTALEHDRASRASAAEARAFEMRVATLSGRERDVMWLVADGLGNREIAASLGLSPRTVEIYKARMLEKLGLDGLPDLLRAVRGVQRSGR